MAMASSTTSSLTDVKSNEIDSHTGQKFSPANQIFAGIVVSMIASSVGAHNSLPSIVLPHFNITTASHNTSGTAEETFQMSFTQKNWFAGSHSMSAGVGCLCASLLVHKLGPRSVIVSLSLPCLVGWMLLSYATSYTMMLFGRLLVGFSSGNIVSASQVYLSEFSSPHMRGRLVCLSGLLNTLGSLTLYLADYLLPWRYAPVCIITLYLVPGISCLWFVPESPYWLIRQGRKSEALQSLSFLRGNNSHQAALELQMMVQSHTDHERLCAAARSPRHSSQQQRQQQVTASSNTTRRVSFARTLRRLSSVVVLVPFVCVCALFVLRVLTGFIVFIVFAIDILTEMRSAYGAHESVLVIGCWRLFCSVASALFVSDRFGRRPLLMISGIGCCVCNIFFAVYLKYLLAISDDGWLHAVQFLPLPVYLVFVGCFDFGFARSGWIIQGELLGSDVRSALSGPTIVVHFGVSFLTVFFYPSMRLAIGMDNCYFCFALFSLLGFALVYYMIPETKNKRLEEIQMFYRSRYGVNRIVVDNVSIHTPDSVCA